MSRWLQSVNTLLETLDGQAGNVADETENAISALLTPRDGVLTDSDDDNITDDASDPDQSAMDEDIDDDGDDDDDMEYVDDYVEEGQDDGADGVNSGTHNSNSHGDYLDDVEIEEEYTSDDADYEEEEVVDLNVSDEEEIEVEVDDNDVAAADDDDEDEDNSNYELESTEVGYLSGDNPFDVQTNDSDESGISLPIRSRHTNSAFDRGGVNSNDHDNDTVSDLSCSQYDEDLNDGIDIVGEHSLSTMPRIDIREDQNDVPPKTPNRQLSDKEQKSTDKQGRLFAEQHELAHDMIVPLAGGISSPPFGDTPSNPNTGASNFAASSSAPNTSNTYPHHNSHRSSHNTRARRRASGTERSLRSMLDESPVPPRRSLDLDSSFRSSSKSSGDNAVRRTSGDRVASVGAVSTDRSQRRSQDNSDRVTSGGDWGDVSRKSRSGHVSGGGMSNNADSEHPPKLPTRQPSHPRTPSVDNSTGRSSQHFTASTSEDMSKNDVRPAPSTPPKSQNVTPTKTKVKLKAAPVSSASDDYDAQVHASPMSAISKTRKPMAAPTNSGNDAQVQQYKQQILKQQQELQLWQKKAQSYQDKYKKAQVDLKQMQAKAKQAEKQLKLVQVQLETSNAEIEAQQRELQNAADRLERDRQRANDEREDLLDEQEDELDRLTTKHAEELKTQKMQYEKQIAQLQQRVSMEESKRKQEGGDWTKELEQALERERDALKRLSEIDAEKDSLQTRLSESRSRADMLQSKLSASTDSANLATERERALDERLEATIASHARQMKQRQAREAELEQTIFELGAALTAARQQQQRRSAGTSGTGAERVNEDDEAIDTDARIEELSKAVKDLKESLDRSTDELETTKGMLATETHRRTALQKELQDIAEERRAEESSALARQRKLEMKISELEAMVARLRTTQGTDTIGSAEAEASHSNTTVSDARYKRVINELERSRKEVARLSEQLVRHQGRAKSTASEILALRDRLQAANARAENAENSLVAIQTTSSSSSAMTPTGSTLTARRLYEVEGGGVGYSDTAPARRRVKGGNRMRQGQVRSIRAALQLHRGGASVNALSQTIDVLDTWSIDTMSILRQEPLARLGFMAYILLLHFWSFALVVFHTAEVPHGDFGSMGSNPRNWRQHE